MLKPCEKPTPRGKRIKSLPRNLKSKTKGEGDLLLSIKEAVEEAKRCLGLRYCESCDLCSLLCPELCITRDEKTGQVQIDLDYCKGCGICAAICPRGAIQMVLENE